MNAKELINKQRNFFKKGYTYDYSFREKNLKKLKKCIEKNEKQIYEALKKDLNKPAFEAFVGEVGFVIKEIDFVIKHLKEWMKPKKVPTDIVNQPAKSYIYYQPYGVTLIISPWNYPFHLSIMPLIGAIAGGNTAIIKPSEYSQHSSYILKKMIESCFDEEYIKVVTGGKETVEKLLEYKFDKIFYTGNSRVGKIIMKKAAEHLTPITLELGGKSPAIVLKDAKLDIAAKRIVWGKFFNAGQTCVAVDYIAAEKPIYNRLVKLLIKYTKKFYEKTNLNKNYSKIINKKHFHRLTKLIDNSNVIYSRGYDERKLLIYPTIVEASTEDKVMEDEIFGPILPVVKFENYESIKSFINSLPSPLAMYIFTENDKKSEKILREIQSGGVTINDTLIHLSSNYLPFGGIGESGMGSYHGIHSFTEFSQKRSVVKRSTSIDIPIRYPAYNSAKLKFVKKLF